MPIMNPSPTDIVELFTFVEVTLVQYATDAGHLHGVSAAAAKVKPKKVNKVEVVQEEPPKKDSQAYPTTPRPKGHAEPTTESKRAGKSAGKCKKGKPEKRR